MGLDLVNGTIRNNLEAGVIEPAMSKVKIIQVKHLSCFLAQVDFFHKFKSLKYLKEFCVVTSLQQRQQ